MVDQVYSSTVVYLLVLFGYIGYVIFHQIQIDRTVALNKLQLGFWDRLLLFRLPVWKSKSLENSPEVESRSRHLAWQFLIVSLLVFGFFQFGVFYFGSTF